ncbi:hypothetical protein AKJ16_DCAP20394 [Drosera capensis]
MRNLNYGALGLFRAVLAKEGRMPSFSDVVSGIFKVYTIALKPVKDKESSSSGSKPKMMLWWLSVGGRRYGVIILIVVVGYGCVWWKGWKLPDLSFATKRSLSDATTSIAKQLEQVTGLCERMRSLDVNIKSFHEAVQILATKIHSIHGNEEETNKRVLKLVGIVKNLETGRRAEQLQACAESLFLASSSVASRPSLEHAPLAPFSRTASVPPVLSLEPPSPSASCSIGSNEAQQWVSTTNSSVGLKDLEEMGETRAVTGSPRITNGDLVLADSNSSSSSGPFGWSYLALPGSAKRATLLRSHQPSPSLRADHCQR